VLDVHELPFVEAVKTSSAGYGTPVSMRFGLGTGDVPVFFGMHEATQQVCGGSIEAARMIAENSATRVLQLGGGLHHAMPTRAAGFCVYNDVGMAIQALRSSGMRVAFVDIDVHHSDGVQTMFYDDPEVLTVSLHESGRFLFPGTGFVHESGGPGAVGSAINVPLHPGTDDENYLECFDAIVPDALERFGADVLVIEVGADAHFRDPLAGLSLTTAAYVSLFDRLVNLGETTCSGRLMATLGGGYGFDATLRIWTLLAFRLSETQPPDTLPPDWRESWMSKTGLEISSRLLDEPDDIPPSRYSTVASRNNRDAVAELRKLVDQTRS
jgi:acetoin utilization protein AcuC